MRAIIVGVVLFFVFRFLDETNTSTIKLILWGLVLLLIICFISAGITLNKAEKLNEDNDKKQKDFIKSKAREYKEGLAKKRTQLVTKDDYGDIDESKWKAEIVTFFNNKIGAIPEELALTKEDKVVSAEDIAKIIDDVALEGQKEQLSLFSYSEEMNGIEYEHFCASLLRNSGWEAIVSPASGDQGADIIAKRDHIKVAIQCKKYSTPIGNKAVQEVSASKLYYGTDHAVVVTNNSFTSSAKQLANSARVHLLHHSELNRLQDILDQ